MVEGAQVNVQDPPLLGPTLSDENALFSFIILKDFYKVTDNDGPNERGHQHLQQFEFQHSNLRSLLLLVALSFHSVFEARLFSNFQFSHLLLKKYELVQKA